jgi:hypothetical protein
MQKGDTCVEIVDGVDVVDSSKRVGRRAARRLLRPLSPLKSTISARVAHMHPFGYPRMTHSRDAPMLAVDCDSVMLIVSWMSNLELIAANS